MIKILRQYLKVLSVIWLLFIGLLMYGYAMWYAFPVFIRYMCLWNDAGPEATRRMAVKLHEESKRKRSARLRYMAIEFNKMYLEDINSKRHYDLQ